MPNAHVTSLIPSVLDYASGPLARAHELDESAPPQPGHSSAAAAPARLIDPAVLERLCEELDGSMEIARRFALDFAATWDHRISRLYAACRNDDTGEAQVALLSIRSTAEMVGATLLAETAQRLERDCERSLVECSVGLPDLADIGARTVEALLTQV